MLSITGYGRVPENDEDALKWAVAHGPIVAAIEADEDFMRNSTVHSFLISSVWENPCEFLMNLVKYDGIFNAYDSI